jgi:hypothetical protein
MKPIYHYSSVLEALENLTKMGFSYDYNIYEEEILKNPHLYEVEHVYRYEGDSNPSDSAIVYGIKSTSGKKGVFVAGYSANSNSEAIRVLTNICVKRNGHCYI